MSLEWTSIILSGEESSEISVVAASGWNEHSDIVVKYVDLRPVGKAGKDITYADRNPIIDDCLWSTGEQLVLNGYDGNNTSADLCFCDNKRSFKLLKPLRLQSKLNRDSKDFRRKIRLYHSGRNSICSPCTKRPIKIV